MHTKRFRFVGFAISLLIIGALTVGADRAHTRGGGVVDPTCTSALPCIEYDNNGTGPGVRGISMDGNGLAGTTKHKSTSQANGREGLFGNDISTSGIYNAGVRGQSINGTGVVGTSSGENGVMGSSSCCFGGDFLGGGGVEALAMASSGEGVTALSFSGDGAAGSTDNTSATTGTAGVVGVDNSTSTPDLNWGIRGTSPHIGVQGDTTTGTGLKAVATTGEGLLVFNNGTSSSNAADILTGSTAGEAVVGLSNGLGVFAFGFASSSSKVPALEADCVSGAPAMIAHSGPVSADIMSLDCSGNMILAGNLTTSGTPLVVKRNAAGTQVATFSARQTVPTLEDLGEAQLVGGRAYVRMAPDFAATIDRKANYLVFLTPQGDTNGLYVTEKTAAGFVVREHNGVSNIVFDYRIVAKPYGELSQRLPTMRVDMHPDKSIVAAIQQAVKAKVKVPDEIAKTLRQAQALRLRADSLGRQAKSLKLRVPQ